MDYEYWTEIHARGGIPAVKSALEELTEADGADPQRVDAAVEAALQVIADDTARLQARADQAEERLRQLREEAAEVERQVEAGPAAEG
ncbi:hypothetical protein [Streptomyces sp. NPDC059009]|uniref:hypothetical protein n=1 Tax=Streptomyces sp. NPDC059009 TaxID=3346694 RepID=UPI0036BB1E4C